jgi:hypothetical protein
MKMLKETLLRILISFCMQFQRQNRRFRVSENGFLKKISNFKRAKAKTLTLIFSTTRQQKIVNNISALQYTDSTVKAPNFDNDL